MRSLDMYPRSYKYPLALTVEYVYQKEPIAKKVLSVGESSCLKENEKYFFCFLCLFLLLLLPLISSPTLQQPMNAQHYNVLKKNHNSATVCTAEFFSGDDDEAHFVNWKCPSKKRTTYYLRALRELVGIFIDTLLLLLVLCTIYIVCAALTFFSFVLRIDRGFSFHVVSSYKLQ